MTLDKLNVEAVLRNHTNDIFRKGLAQYIYLISKFHEFCDGERNLSEDNTFKGVYNAFFKLGMKRKKDDLEKFRVGYYEYMNREKKNKDLTLREVLENLKKLPRSRVERSFGSKLLSMIDSENNPPWDENVKIILQKTGILWTRKTKKGMKIPSNDCIFEWNGFYTDFCEWYRRFINSKDTVAVRWIEQFDSWFKKDWYKWYVNFLDKKKKQDWIGWLDKKQFTKEKILENITRVKKIDLILWQAGGKEKKNDTTIWLKK